MGQHRCKRRLDQDREIKTTGRSHRSNQLPEGLLAGDRLSRRGPDSVRSPCWRFFFVPFKNLIHNINTTISTKMKNKLITTLAVAALAGVAFAAPQSFDFKDPKA